MTKETDKLIEDVLKEVKKKYFSETPEKRWEIFDFSIKEALKLLAKKIQEEEIIGEKEMKNRAIGYDLGYEKAKQEMQEENKGIRNLYLDGIKDATTLSKVFQFEEGIKEGKRQMEEENNHLNQNGSKNDDNFAKVKFPSGSEYIKEISLALKEFEKNVKNIPFSGLIHYGVQSDYYDKLIQLLHTGKLGKYIIMHDNSQIATVKREPELKITDSSADNKPSSENINSVIESSQTKSASDKGLKKEYALKLNPYITIQEEAKEDFKKFMSWNEEQFMEKVIVRLKGLDNQVGRNPII